VAAVCGSDGSFFDLDDDQPTSEDEPSDPQAAAAAHAAAVAAATAQAQRDAAVQASRNAAAAAFDTETKPDSPAALDNGELRTTEKRGMAKPPLPAAPAVTDPPVPMTAPAPMAPPLSPHQLSKQLRRSPDVVKVRPSRGIPALFVLFVVLAIAAAWLFLFQRP